MPFLHLLRRKKAWRWGNGKEEADERLMENGKARVVKVEKERMEVTCKRERRKEKWETRFHVLGLSKEEEVYKEEEEEEGRRGEEGMEKGGGCQRGGGGGGGGKGGKDQNPSSLLVMALHYGVRDEITLREEEEELRLERDKYGDKMREEQEAIWADDLCRSAFRFFSLSHYSHASDLFSQALSINSSCFNATLGKAMVYGAQSDFDKASHYIHRALDSAFSSSDNSETSKRERDSAIVVLRRLNDRFIRHMASSSNHDNRNTTNNTNINKNNNNSNNNRHHQSISYYPERRHAPSSLPLSPRYRHLLDIPRSDNHDDYDDRQHHHQQQHHHHQRIQAGGSRIDPLLSSLPPWPSFYSSDNTNGGEGSRYREEDQKKRRNVGGGNGIGGGSGGGGGGHSHQEPSSHSRHDSHLGLSYSHERYKGSIRFEDEDSDRRRRDDGRERREMRERNDQRRHYDDSRRRYDAQQGYSRRSDYGDSEEDENGRRRREGRRREAIENDDRNHRPPPHRDSRRDSLIEHRHHHMGSSYQDHDHSPRSTHYYSGQRDQTNHSSSSSPDRRYHHSRGSNAYHLDKHPHQHQSRSAISLERSRQSHGQNKEDLSRECDDFSRRPRHPAPHPRDYGQHTHRDDGNNANSSTNGKGNQQRGNEGGSSLDRPPAPLTHLTLNPRLRSNLNAFIEPVHGAKADEGHHADRHFDTDAERATHADGNRADHAHANSHSHSSSLNTQHRLNHHAQHRKRSRETGSEGSHNPNKAPKRSSDVASPHSYRSSSHY